METEKSPIDRAIVAMLPSSSNPMPDPHSLDNERRGILINPNSENNATGGCPGVHTPPSAVVFVNEVHCLAADTNGAAVAANAVNSPSNAVSNKPPLHTLQYTGSVMCRICHNTDRIDRLISPCLCKGTQGFVHRHCLEYWLSRSGILHCELCMHRFQTQTTLRYNCCEAIRIWFRHPNNRGLLQSDLMVCSLLTIVTFGLVSMSLVGLQYFMMQGNRMGFSRNWTQGSLITFLVIIIAAYLVNIFLIVRAQVGPWYRWWRSVRFVRVILPKVKPSVERKMHDIRLGASPAVHSTDV